MCVFREDADTQPDYFHDVTTFVDYIRGHTEKGTEISDITVNGECGRSLWR